MNIKTVEGLVGATTNINLSDTAMSVYREASQKGDTAAMERALGYAGEMVGQADAYASKAEEGMKADAKELEEKAKAEQEKIIEKHRDDREKLEAQIEKSREPEKDTVKISEEGKTVSMEPVKAGDMSTANQTSDTEEIPPVVYTSTGEINIQTADTMSSVSVLV